MNSERALEIIAAYGADANRWPDAERGAVLELAATQPRVAAALAEARRFDALLAGWARDVVPSQFDVAAMAGLRQAAPGLPVKRWIAGSALAAAVAVGVAILAPMQDPAMQIVSTHSPVLSATAEGDAYGSDAEVFAKVFTPTADEDEMI